MNSTVSLAILTFCSLKDYKAIIKYYNGIANSSPMTAFRSEMSHLLHLGEWLPVGDMSILSLGL